MIAGRDRQCQMVPALESAMSTPRSSDPLPSVILFARRAKQPAKSPNEDSVPWMKILIGAAIAFQVVIAIFAVYALFLKTPTPADTNNGLPPLAAVVKDPVGKPADDKQVKPKNPANA